MFFNYIFELYFWILLLINHISFRTSRDQLLLVFGIHYDSCQDMWEDLHLRDMFNAIPWCLTCSGVRKSEVTPNGDRPIIFFSLLYHWRRLWDARYNCIGLLISDQGTNMPICQQCHLGEKERERDDTRKLADTKTPRLPDSQTHGQAIKPLMELGSMMRYSKTIAAFDMQTRREAGCIDVEATIFSHFQPFSTIFMHIIWPSPTHRRHGE